MLLLKTRFMKRRLSISNQSDNNDHQSAVDHDQPNHKKSRIHVLAYLSSDIFEHITWHLSSRKDLLHLALVDKETKERMKPILQRYQRFVMLYYKCDTIAEFKSILKNSPVYLFPCPRICLICKTSLFAKCFNHQKTITILPQICPIAIGDCKHPFHGCCIERWLSQRECCPLDNGNWNTLTLLDK